jgi:hypothetical protein
MSHNVTVESTTIKSLAILKKAVDLLKARGVNVDLLENAHYRGYNSSQSGNHEVVINLKNSPWDIAMDYNNDKESYNIIYDPYADTIRKAIGLDDATCKKLNLTKASAEAQIGQLIQAYNTCVEQDVLTNMGVSTDISYDEENKVYQMVGYVQ